MLHSAPFINGGLRIKEGWLSTSVVDHALEEGEPSIPHAVICTVCQKTLGDQVALETQVHSGTAETFAGSTWSSSV